MNLHTIVPIAIFAIVLGLVISEKINRTVAALSGAVGLLLFHILEHENVLEYIDFNTLAVLTGMMIIVGIIKNTGVFEFIAIFAAKSAKGDPWKIILSLCTITAVTSAILDNVTTVLLIAPVTLVITDVLEMDPIPFLIPLILSSNIGGTATLIGDPPNIMIGSAAGLGFSDFVVNLAGIIVVIYIVTFAILKVVYGKKLKASETMKAEIMKFDPNKAITDYVLLKKSGVVLGLVIIGFIIHDKIGYESGLVALAGAMLLVLISKAEVEEVIESVEWPTIFFFVGLFIVVGGLENAGIIDSLASGVLDFTKGNLMFTGILLVWVSAIVSSFLDNIPFVATLIPLIKSIGTSGVMDISSLWWAVSLGACLGGNGTLIGASANLIVAGVAEKHGNKISFARYMKVGFPLMILSIILSTAYLAIFFLR